MSRLYSTQKYKGFYDKNKTKQKNYFFMTFLQKTLAFFKNLCYNSCVRKFAKMNMEAYRSGHNGTDSKSVVPHGTVGSNPTASAKERGMLFSIPLSLTETVVPRNLGRTKCARGEFAFLLAK